jgi:hypothetical protein
LNFFSTLVKNFRLLQPLRKRLHGFTHFLELSILVNL